MNAPCLSAGATLSVAVEESWNDKELIVGTRKNYLQSKIQKWIGCIIRLRRLRPLECDRDRMPHDAPAVDGLRCCNDARDQNNQHGEEIHAWQLHLLIWLR